VGGRGCAARAAWPPTGWRSPSSRVAGRGGSARAKQAHGAHCRHRVWGRRSEPRRASRRGWARGGWRPNALPCMCHGPCVCRACAVSSPRGCGRWRWRTSRRVRAPPGETRHMRACVRACTQDMHMHMHMVLSYEQAPSKTRPSSRPRFGPTPQRTLPPATPRRGARGCGVRGCGGAGCGGARGRGGGGVRGAGGDACVCASEGCGEGGKRGPG
jgi:hypothetical protein